MNIKKILHDWLDYGYPTTREGGDHFVSTYNCRFCDRAVTQDSQGNWFHLTRTV